MKTSLPGVIYGKRADAQIQKTVREVARRMMNTGGHRARWQQHQLEADIIEGLVSHCMGDGWYEVELATWADEPAGFAGSGATDYTQNCDVCDAANDAYPLILGECASQQIIIERTRPAGTGVFVYAHDARRIPLEDGGHVRMLKGHISGSGEQLYVVVSGEYKLVRQAIPDYECCDGAVTLVGCDYIIHEGVLCDGWSEGCPS